MKLSFSLSSTKPSAAAKAPPPPSFTDDHSSNPAAPRPEFVTVFDPSKTLDPTPRPIIPPLPNTSLFGRPSATSLPPPSDPSDPLRFVLDAPSDPSSATVSYGLTLRPKPPSLQQPSQETNEISEPVRRPDPAIRPFREDIHSYPDDRGADEFADISVEAFAEALLAGHGWYKGRGIGPKSKGDTKVVQSERRAVNTAGLGYVPAPGDPSRSKRMRPGAGGEEKKPESREQRREETPDGKRGARDEYRIRDRRREEKPDVKEKKTEPRERGGRHERRDESSRDRKRNRDEDVKPSGKSSSNGTGSRVHWLTSNIKVRVVSKEFRHGKLYRQKGRVVDVVGRKMCTVVMDEGGEIVEGAEQEVLETALPKRGGSVLVLYGKHKGVFGRLVEKDMDEEMGVVEEDGSRAQIKVGLDQIAEYVGDPMDLGY